MRLSKVNICGLFIDNVSLEETVGMIDGFVRKKEPVFVVTPNVDHIIKLQRDKEFMNVYKKASLTLADGMPVLWAASFLGRKIKEKISGSDLFPEICKKASEAGYRLYFLGGRPTAAEKTARILEKKYPNIQIVGIYSPPFGFEDDEKENEKIVEMIKKAKPDILCVGLGAPKQEKWIFNHYRELGVSVSIGIGVTFEYVSGMVRRSPRWMQKTGFEWLWRLLVEPKRLWKRYLIYDVGFLGLILAEKLKYMTADPDRKKGIFYRFLKLSVKGIMIISTISQNIMLGKK